MYKNAQTFATVCIVACTIANAQENLIRLDEPEKHFIVTTFTRPLTFSVETNRTTGFNWYLEQYDSKLVQPLSSQYGIADILSKMWDNNEAVGTPQLNTWTFDILPAAFAVPTITTITLRYTRPWQPEIGQQKIITIFTQP